LFSFSLSKNDFLGHIVFPLSSLLRHHVVAAWFDLLDKDCSEMVGGELFLVLSIHNDDNEAPLDWEARTQHLTDLQTRAEAKMKGSRSDKGTMEETTGSASEAAAQADVDKQAAQQQQQQQQQQLQGQAGGSAPRAPDKS
jgi:hypothetical protein